jgi:hypothetical protein
MAFWVFWTRGPRKIRQGEGYFNCPTCKERRPCEMFQMFERTHLYGFIRLSRGEPVGPELNVCMGCRQEFAADEQFGYSFSAEAEPPTWRCFKCHKQVAYDLFERPHCGYHLKLGR